MPPPRMMPTDRPHDVDHGLLELPTIFAIDSSRPPHTAGRCNCCHPSTEIAFLVSGATHARVGRQQSVLRGGEFHVFGADIPHTTHTEKAGSRGLYLQVRPEEVERVRDALGIRSVPDYTKPRPLSAKVRAVVSALRHELASSPAPTPLLVESLALYLIGHALGHEPEASAASRDKRLDRAVAWMRALPHEAHSLDELAADAGLSKFRFAHLFRAHFGISPHAYLTRLRVERGADLLRESDLPVTQVALDVGFSSSSRFARALRAHLGTTPTAYRVARSKIGP